MGLVHVNRLQLDQLDGAADIDEGSDVSETENNSNDDEEINLIRNNHAPLLSRTNALSNSLDG